MRLLAVFLLLLIVPQALAEEQSVRPGVNSYYQNPEWLRWVNIFESPGREVYDHRNRIVDYSGVREGMDIADIGAGTGLFTRLFAVRTGAEGTVYAVDISAVFIDNILREARQLGLNNVKGIVNDPKDAGLSANSIDLAFLADTYHHFEYPRSMLASIHAALRPHGKLIVIDFRRDPHRSSDWVMRHVRAGRQEVIREITSAGFRLVDDSPMLRTNYYLVFRKAN